MWNLAHKKQLFHDRNLSLLTQKGCFSLTYARPPCERWTMLWSARDYPKFEMFIFPLDMLYCYKLVWSFPKFRQLLVMTVWGLQDIGYQSSDTIIISLAHSLLCCKYQDHYCLTEKTPTNNNLILQLSPVLWISVLNTRFSVKRWSKGYTNTATATAPGL